MNQEQSYKDFRLVIGKRIREIRISKAMTQDELAHKASLTTANVCNIENGRYSVGIDILKRITDALDVKIRIE